jgi:hypothetical protein
MDTPLLLRRGVEQKGPSDQARRGLRSSYVRLACELALGTTARCAGGERCLCMIICAAIEMTDLIWIDVT